jgi:hypothetical protein
MDEHDFCRAMLRETMTEVRKRTTVEQRKKSWGWRSDKHIEFHGPDGYFWHGRGCCVYQARAQGWSAWMAKQDEKANAVVEETLALITDGPS